MRSGQYMLDRRRARRLLIPGIVLGLALAGCNANPEPAPLPTEGVSSSTTTSPNPSLTAPTMPAEAQGLDAKSAKSFVRHWVATLNYAAATGDTASLNRLSDPRCESCTAISQKIDRVYGNGGYVEGEGWAVRSISAVPAQPRLSPLLQVTMFLSEQKIVEASGQEPNQFDGGKQPMMFRLKERDGGWLVTRIDEVQ